MRIKWRLMNQETGGEGAAGGASSAEGGDNKSAIDPAEYETLKSQVASFQESISKLESNNRALMQEKVEAKKAAEKAAMEAAKKSGDVDAVEKSWNDKYSALETSKSEESQRYERMIQNLTVGAAATKLATDLAIQGSADVLLPHISARLAVEIKDDKPIVRVLDKEGKPSAMTIKELQAEFQANPVFAPVIAGSKASGSGFNTTSTWNGNGQVPTVTRAELDRMSPVDRHEFFVKKKGKVIEARV